MMAVAVAVVESPCRSQSSAGSRSRNMHRLCRYASMLDMVPRRGENEGNLPEAKLATAASESAPSAGVFVGPTTGRIGGDGTLCKRLEIGRFANRDG